MLNIFLATRHHVIHGYFNFYPTRRMYTTSGRHIPDDCDVQSLLKIALADPASVW